MQELEDDPTVPRAAYVGNHSLAEGRTGVIGGLACVGAMVAARRGRIGMAGGADQVLASLRLIQRCAGRAAQVQIGRHPPALGPERVTIDRMAAGSQPRRVVAGAPAAAARDAG